jgi:hypothetical protein
MTIMVLVFANRTLDGASEVEWRSKAGPFLDAAKPVGWGTVACRRSDLGVTGAVHEITMRF